MGLIGFCVSAAGQNPPVVVTVGVEDYPKFVTSVARALPFVEKIVQMRNAVDHPKTEPGAPMVYKNFDFGQTPSGELVLVDPTWGLTGEPLRPMLQDFDQIIETIITLGEQILVNLFDKFKMAPMLVIDEIPIERRDPAKPTRLYVTIAGHEAYGGSSAERRRRTSALSGAGSL